MIQAVNGNSEGYCPDRTRLASAFSKTQTRRRPTTPNRRLELVHPPQAGRLDLEYPQHATPQAHTEHATLQSSALRDVNARQIA